MLIRATYLAAVFLNAALLFTAELLFGKLVLPLLGGTSAVWSTCMLFFQAVLLGGYLYAHVAVRTLGTQRSAVVHLALGALALATLPLALPDGWTPPVAGSPVPWLLALLGASLGAPFFALSAGAPLLQRWFADAAPGTDPYRLYAASNLGSVAALLAYPLALEPALTLPRQSSAWTAAFAALLVLLVACAWPLRRAGRGAEASPPAATPPVPAGTRLRWIALSAVPSSLLLGVTAHVTSDVAPLPLLWVGPLALYLLTFVAAFGSGSPEREPAWLLSLVRLVVIPLLLATALRFVFGTAAALLPHLLGFTLLALLCHRRLAAARPATERLTEYYAWISLGGLLGSAFNVLAAPLAFSSLLEYPLALLAALALLGTPGDRSARAIQRDVVIAAAWGAALGVLGVLLVRFGPDVDDLLRVALLAPAGVALLGAAERPTRVALVGLSVLLACLTSGVAAGGMRTLARARSFYGTYSVRLDAGGGSVPVHLLAHGTTVHGVQRRDAASRREPLAYYARSGPVGDAFAALPAATRGRIAAVGLGAGALACYALPGAAWTFYEIDPVVVALARDTSLFSFLHDCAPASGMVLGDARVRLARTPAASVDLLVLDAFTSDAIPMHLLTREAFAEYAQRLSPHGVLLVHVSNRHLDLEPVVAATARAAGLRGVTRLAVPNAAEAARGVYTAQWIALAARERSLGALPARPGWRPLPEAGTVWSDDYSNLLGALRR